MSPRSASTNPPIAFAELGEHCLAAVDADDVEAGLCHGHGETSGADTQFEHPPTCPGQFDHPCDGGVDVGDVGVPSSYTSANPSPYERWSYPCTRPRLWRDRSRGQTPAAIGSVAEVTEPAITYLDHAASTPMRRRRSRR